MKRTFLLLSFIASIGVLKAQEATGSGSSSTRHHKSKKVKREVSSEKILSGASNILPFNHWVRVTNTMNNLSVVLRINDRMYKNNKRLIDLSKSAAKKLKYTGYGLAHVKVEVLGKKLKEGIVRD